MRDGKELGMDERWIRFAPLSVASLNPPLMKEANELLAITVASIKTAKKTK